MSNTANSAHDLATLEMRNNSIFQRRQHVEGDTPELTKEETAFYDKVINVLQSEDGSVETIIASDIKKYIWMLPTESNLNLELNEMTKFSDVLNYEVDTRFHFIMDSKINQKLKSIRIKKAYSDKYVIRYVENLAHHMFPQIELNLDKKNGGDYDNIWMDNNVQFFVENVPDYMNLIGNRPHLRDWSTVLPDDVVTLPLLLNYTQNIRKMFPLFPLHKNKTKKLIHSVNYVRDLLKLIQMAKKTVDDKGQVTYTLTELRPEILEYSDKYDNILNDIPELKGRYVLIDDQYVNDFNASKTEFQYKFISIVKHQSVNPVKFGKVARIELYTDLPASTIFITARSQDALKYNAYSNYTDHEIDSAKGKSAIKDISMLYGGSYKIYKRTSYEMSKSCIYNVFPHMPVTNGYHALTWEIKPGEDYSYGQVLKHSKPILEVTLGQTYPYISDFTSDVKNIDDDAGVEDGKYIDPKHKMKYDILVRIVTYNIITINSEGNIDIHPTKDDDKFTD